MNDDKEPTLTMRASWGSYVVFCGIWIILTIGYVLLAFYRSGSGALKGALIAGVVGSASVLWMAGHRVRVASGVLEYRDGFYRSRRIHIADVESLSTTPKRRRILGRELVVPCLTVVARNRAESIDMNPKPFSREGHRALRKVLHLDAGKACGRKKK